MLRRLAAGAALALLTGGLAPMSPAAAASFTVNSSGDAGDANAGNGVCATAGNFCTLRAAIREANSLPGSDVITLAWRR